MAAVRVFCTDPTLPTLRDCLGFAAGAGPGVILAVDTDDAEMIDPDSPDWSHVRLVYREDASPLTVTALRETDPTPLVRETRDRFIAAVAQSDAPQAEMVRTHLGATRTIVEVTFPPDADEDALEAAAWFTRIFVAKYGALLQADGEGFFDQDNDLILPMP